MKIKYFFAVILTAVFLTACGEKDPQADYLKSVQASAEENESQGSDDGGQEIDVDDPSYDRFAKAFDIPDCTSVSTSHRDECWAGNATQVYRGLVQLTGKVSPYVRAYGEDKINQLYKLATQAQSEIGNCKTVKCKALAAEKWYRFYDIMLYTSMEHQDKTDGVVRDEGRYGQTCVRLKKNKQRIIVRDDAGSILYTVHTGEGSGQYTAVGTGKQSKKPLLVESTGKSEVMRFNGAVVGFVDEADIEEVKEGALCEPIDFIYDRDSYQ